MKKYFSFYFVLFLFLYGPKNLAMTSDGDGVELIRFLFTENYAVDRVVEHLSQQDCLIGQKFEKICSNGVNFVDFKFLNSYVEKKFNLGEFFNKTSPEFKIKSMLAPLVLYDLHEDRELSENIYQLFKNPGTGDSGKEITYINAYNITFGERYAGNTVYKKRYDKYRQIFESQKEKEREKYELRQRAVESKKQKKKPVLGSKITITPCVQNEPKRNENVSRQKNTISKPKIDDTAIIEQMCNHFNIVEKDEKDVFAGLIDLIKTEYSGELPNVIYSNYIDNNFDLETLLDHVKKNCELNRDEASKVRHMIGLISLYTFLDPGSYNNFSDQSKNFLNKLYFSEETDNKVKTIDELYQKIYIINDCWQQIPALKCRYEIASKNQVREGSKNHRDNLGFLQHVITLNLTAHMTNFSWIDLQGVTGYLEQYLEQLSKFDNGEDLFCNLFTDNTYDIFKNQRTIAQYFSAIIHFFTKTDNKDLGLDDNEKKRLVEYLGSHQEKINDFLDGCQGKYTEIFTQIFITYFGFDWLLQNNKEDLKKALERLQYFNVFDCKEKRKISQKSAENLFEGRSTLFLFELLGKNESKEQLVRFIENNIEYKGEPLEIIQEFRNSFAQEFLDVCQKVGFIDEKTQFKGDNENFIFNQNNNNQIISNQNIQILHNNDLINDSNFFDFDNELSNDEWFQLIMQSSLQDHSPNNNYDDDLKNAIKQSLQTPSNTNVNLGDYMSDEGLLLDGLIQRFVTQYCSDQNLIKQ